MDISDYAMYRRARLGIGYLPQESSVFTKMTVWNNLMAIAETLPLSKSERIDKVESTLEDFNLTNIASQMAFTLSGGEDDLRLQGRYCHLLSSCF